MYQPEKDLSATGSRGRFANFADAIRFGCMLRPRQCFETLFEGADAACALGAARVAGYDEYQHDETNDGVECPFDDCGEDGAVFDMVPHLNDAHRCTRERIADWLEMLG